MENLEFNIFDEDITGQEFFSDEENTEDQDAGQTSSENTDKEDKNITTDVDPETIFGSDTEDDAQESVGSDEDKKDKGNSTSRKSSHSPNNTYSSIAAALKEDGVLLNLEDEDVLSIEGADDFAEIIEKEVTKRMDDSQRRIKEALDYGVAPTDVSNYEKTLNYLDSLDDDAIKDESDKGVLLRQQLLFQDYVNRGFSESRAKREMEKSFNAGTDIEDSLESLASNKQYFREQYADLVNTAKEETQAQKEAVKQQMEELKKSILDTEEPYEGVKLSKTKRQKIYNSLTKVVSRTKDGRGLNAIQKYEMENPIEFKQKLATLFELTDGFTKLSTLVQGKVGKENRRNLKELEHALRNTPTYPDGRLKLANAIEDENSYQGLRLDI